MNPYETLDVPKDATDAEIKSAYKDLSKKHHPDKPGGSKERMSDINNAKQLLLDPAKRRRYDTTGEFGNNTEQNLVNSKMAELVGEFLSDPNAMEKDLIKFLKNKLWNAKKSFKQQTKDAEKELKSWAKKKSRVKGDGPLRMIYDGTIEQAMNMLEHKKQVIASELELVGKIEEALTGHEFVFDKPVEKGGFDSPIIWYDGEDPTKEYLEHMARAIREDGPGRFRPRY
jgi:curved DNA-binding protein CbpA